MDTNIDQRRLFLLDAYALIYRAYYALIRTPRVTSAGFNTSAIFGFCNTLDEILRKENPTHIAVCFDPPGGMTFRHEEYPEYKAQRDKQPEDITASIPYIKEILAAFRIPVIEVPGYEADDVIGTLSRMAEREGFMTYMMTPDKDYGQLVTDRVFMYRPAMRGEGFEVRGPEEVCRRYGISSPRQIIDLLALEGDASDNVPGCPGVGEKTAAKLIGEWGSVENLLAHAAELKGAVGKKVTANIDQIRMSKWLVTINTDVPLGDVTPDALIRKEANIDALLDVYRRLEFRTFINRLMQNRPQQGNSGSAASNVPPKKTAVKEEPAMRSLFDLDEPGSVSPAGLGLAANSIASSECRYETVSGAADVAAKISEVANFSEIGLTVLADGADAMTARIYGVAIACEGQRAFYVSLAGDDREEMESLMSPLFEESGPLVVSRDIKRDYLLLRRCGIRMDCRYFDTGVAHYLLAPEMKHDQEKLSLAYLNYEMLPSPKNIADGELIMKVACERADIALRLKPVLLDEIGEQGLMPLLSDVEMPLVRVLAEMEWTGVRIDARDLAALSVTYTERMRGMEERVYELAGTRFNIASPMQVGEVLFGQMKLDPKAKRTKSGSFSTTEEILEKYRGSYEIVDLILRIRALRKLLSTYVNALPALVNPQTGKIHTSYNQTVTATGRISSTNPNLQNIPVRTDDGREIRRAFIADPGDIFMSADYSQIELRLMAELSGDHDLVEAFLSGADIHRATAAKIYHKALEDVTDDERRHAKTANFGIIYGISAFGLSERLGIPRGEAKNLISGYFRSYPGVKEYMDRSITEAREKKYVTTIKGRKRFLPDIDSRSAVVRGYAERNAINAPLQGSAADIIKIAMINIYNEMTRRGMKSRMIMQVHDELVFNVVPEEIEQLTALVVEKMENAFVGRIPLEVSVGTGKNWLEAH